MAFSIPSIPDIWKRTKAAFRANLPGTDAWIEPNNLSISGKVFSLGLFEAYQRIGYLYRQLFASTADAYHLRYRHAYEYGLQLKPAAAATGIVQFAQLIVTPQVLPAGMTVIRDDGVVFTTTAPVAFASGLANVPVIASTGGADTNTPATTVLQVDQTPSVANIAATVVVDASGLGGGADEETTEELRARVLFRKRYPPHGGAASDYVEWATSVSGCTRAYVASFTNSNGGLTIYPLFDDSRPNGIPTDADVAAVAAAIGVGSYTGPRPVCSRPYVVAPVATTIDVGISNLVNDTPATRTAIAKQLAALFRYRVDVSTVDAPFVLPRAWIDEAISRATGETRHTLTSPTGDTSIATGHIPVPGTIIFT